jgi:hypothetical protein
MTPELLKISADLRPFWGEVNRRTAAAVCNSGNFGPGTGDAPIRRRQATIAWSINSLERDRDSSKPSAL